MIQLGSTLVEDYPWVYKLDPALSQEGLDDAYERFMDQGIIDLLPTQPGQRPTVFMLRHLRGKAKRRVVGLLLSAGADIAQTPEALFEAAAYGLVAVKDLQTDSGKLVEFESETDSHGCKRIKSSILEQLEQVNDGDLIGQIGRQVIEALTPRKKS